MKYTMRLGAAVLLASALFLVPLSYASDPIPVAEENWSGSVSSGQVTANGIWATSGGFTLTWNISKSGSTYTYAYTFTVAQGLVNHWILQVPPDFFFADHEGTPAGAITTWGASSSNPGIPGDIFGIKWDGTPGNVSFSTKSPPVWGDFYAKDGEAGGLGTNYAFNTGFGTAATEPSAAYVPVPGPLGCPEPADCAYVSSGSKILAVDRETGGITTIADVAAIINDALPEDTTVGPDDRVYACLPSNGAIARVKRDRSELEKFYEDAGKQPQGCRFNSKGDLIFSSQGGGGIWRIPGAAFSSSPAAAVAVAPGAAVADARGLAFLHNGDLLIVDHGTGPGTGRVLLSAHPNYATASVLINGLNQPTGVAVDRRNQIFVSNNDGVYRFNSNGSGGVLYVAFEVEGVPQVPNYLEIIADNTMFVSTADGAFSNGRVFRVEPKDAGTFPASEDVTMLARMPGSGGVSPAAAGIGVGGTSMSLTKDYAVGINTNVYNFGPYQVEFTSDIIGQCSLTVTASQQPPASYNELLAAHELHATAIPFLGEEGRVVSFEAAKPECFGTDASIYIAGFYETGNPRTARFSFDESTETTTASILQLIGFYPIIFGEGGFGDPGVDNRIRDFSEFLVVEQETIVGGVVGASGNFCGFSSPLSNTSDPALASTFNSGRNVTVKFQIGADSSCKKNFITTAHNILAVSRVFDQNLNPVSPTQRMVVQPSGSSVPEPPVFRFSEGQYSYTLSTTGYPPGYYLITVISDVMSVQSTWMRLR